MVGGIIKIVDHTGLTRTIKVYGFKTPGDMGKWVMFDLGKRFKIIDVHTFGEASRKDIMESLSPDAKKIADELNKGHDLNEVIKFADIPQQDLFEH